MGIQENRETFVAFIEALDWSIVVMDDPSQCILGQFGSAHPELIKWTPEMAETVCEYGPFDRHQAGPYTRLSLGWEVVFGELRNYEGLIKPLFGWTRREKATVLAALRKHWNLPAQKPLPQCLTDAVTRVTVLNDHDMELAIHE